MSKISNERFLQSLLDTFDGYIYICSPDYRIEYMNSRFSEKTGYKGSDRLCYAALHNLDRPCPWCPNESVFLGETIQWELKSPAGRDTGTRSLTPP